LRDAGAILLGKTNTPEFTLWFQTDNLVYGRTNNPYDVTRTPGGSSGGAAAIIAAGASPFDIGTDTGVSIRLPAHFSGVPGIKPTTGRVPCTGNALPSSGMIAPLTQPGPIARQVADLIMLLPIISGPDNLDPYAVDATWHNPEEVDVGKLRFGFHTDNGIRTPTAYIESAVRDASELLKDEGFEIAEARPAGIEMASFIAARVFGADGGEMVEALLEDSRTESPSPRIRDSINRRAPEISQREFAQVISIWDNYRSSMLGFFDDFDVLICPANAHCAIAHGEEEDMAAYSYTMAYNLTGWPGTVIRAGTDPDGLPIGVQILAKPFREDHCLAVAKWLESRLGPFPGPEISAVNQNASDNVQ
jgi:amidase